MTRKKFPSTLGRDGFALLQALMAVSVFALSLMVSLFYYDVMNTQTVRLTAASDLSELMEGVKGRLSNPTYCSMVASPSVLGGLVYPTQFPAPVFTGPERFGMDLGASFLTEGSLFNGIRVSSIVWQSDLNLGASFRVIGNSVPEANIQIPVEMHLAQLAIQARPNNAQYGSGMELSKSLSLVLGLILPARTIFTCVVSMLDAATFCDSMGGAMVGNKCQMDKGTVCNQVEGRWNPGHQSCREHL